MTLFIDVPYSQKDEAKAMGARWDSARKAWFIPDALHAQDRGHILCRFPLLKTDHDQPKGIPFAMTRTDFVFPGEDRTFDNGVGQRLYPDMIPSTCWFTNVRSAVAPRHWSAVRRAILLRAGNRCECCGTSHGASHNGSSIQLECHERWSFDVSTGIQTLVRLIAVCGPCHQVIHFGLAEVKGLRDETLAHFMKVTRFNLKQAESTIDKAWSEWRWRSGRTWTLDISMIERAGIETTGPTDGQSRDATARERTVKARA